MTLRVGSLFSGGGLGDYGLELAGMETVFQVEIDEYCQKVLEKRWPHVPKWKDIRAVNSVDLPECDVIAGGFPCQDISVAGKGEGIEGKRSGLWSEMFRIIREVRPRYVLVENVPALLGRGMGVVLGDLASCGYNCEWDCISASAIGAPHQRDRVWVVAYSSEVECNPGAEKSEVLRAMSKNKRKYDNSHRPGASLANTTASGLQIRQRQKRKVDKSIIRSESASISNRDRKNYVAHAKSKRSERRVAVRNKIETKDMRLFPSGQGEFVGENQWAVEPDVGRVAHGVPSRVDRLKLLGNGQVIQVVEWIGRRIVDHDKQHTDA